MIIIWKETLGADGCGFFFLLFIFFLWQKSHNGDAYVYGFDGCDDFMAVYVSPNSMSCIHQICTTFTCQSSLNKVFF